MRKGKRLLIGALLYLFILSLTGCLDLDEEDYEDDYDYESGYEDDYGNNNDYYEDYEDYEDDYDDTESLRDGWGIEGKSIQLEGLREHYVDTDRAQNAVVMVYMIGSDLESEDGCASDDLYEMMEAELGENVQLVIETGGTSEWQMEELSGGENEIWYMDQDEMRSLGKAEECSMTDKDHLANFISWSAEMFPADRYLLLFWDHGGGTMNGFGYDEIYQNPELSLVDISDALQTADVKFDLIGFDACLMGTIETAYMLEPYADYMIASEEYEPGGGWYYTDWLTMLGENPSVDTIALGKQIIDDFGYMYDNEDVTLSLTELREIPNLYETMSEFLAHAKGSIQENNSNFNSLSRARRSAREYCDGEIDQVDIRDLVRRTEFEGKEEMLQTLGSCVKYRNNSTLKGSYGLAMYFPYRNMDYYSDTSTVLNEIGFQDATEFYNYFLSIMAGRQGSTGTSGFLQKQEEDYSGEDWYEDAQSDFDYEGDIDELYLEETEDGYVLQLTEKEWELITDIQLSVMEEYEGGYLDLGYDNVGSFTDDGDFLVDYGGTWIGIDGIPVAFYAHNIEEKKGASIFSGSVFAILNDEIPIEIELEWEPLTDALAEQPDYESEGFVKGYRVIEENTGTKPKGLKQFKQNDQISFCYEYYDQDGNYVDTVCPYEDLVVTSEESLEVSYVDISEYNAICWGVLIDIYQQEMYTETLEFNS